MGSLFLFAERCDDVDAVVESVDRGALEFTRFADSVCTEWVECFWRNVCGATRPWEWVQVCNLFETLYGMNRQKARQGEKFKLIGIHQQACPAGVSHGSTRESRDGYSSPAMRSFRST